MRALLRWKRLPWVAVAFEGGALLLSGAALAAFSWLFDSHHTLRCAGGFVEATGLAAFGAAGANAAEIAYGVSLFVAVPLLVLLLIASRRWHAVAMSLALFGVAVAVAVPLYGHAPALMYGSAKACT